MMTSTETAGSVRRPVRQAAETPTVWSEDLAARWDVLASWCRRNARTAVTVDVPVELVLAIADRLGALR